MSPYQQSSAVCRILAHSWRLPPPPLNVTGDELRRLTEPLRRTGAGALVWWRLRHAQADVRRAAKGFQTIYRMNAAQALLWQTRAGNLARWLRNRGIDSILIKGGMSARWYADPALRQTGDIDLCVAPDQLGKAVNALSQGRSSAPSDIDLHAGVPDLKGRAWPGIVDRSQLIDLGGIPVRTLCPEDHLRLLCIHFIRHLGEAPLHLCDIAVFLENHPPEFDWDLCLYGDRRLSRWILFVIGLAQHLLGAEVRDRQIARQARLLPSWAVPHMLQTWATSERLPRTVLPYIRNPNQIVRMVDYHVFHPLRAAYRMRLRPQSPLPLIYGAALLGQLVKGMNRLQQGLFGRKQAGYRFDVHREQLF